MNAAGAELLHSVERPWSHTRRWLCIALVLGAQIGLIFAFGDRKPVVPRQPVQVPKLQFADPGNESLALDNPTIFALPSRDGFSRAAWQQVSEVGFHPFQWSEPARWLELPTAGLGMALSEFMQTNLYHAFAFGTKPAPQLNLPKSELPEAITDTPSQLRIEGDLLQRRLLYAPDLLAWPAADLLTDTSVQVLVDRAGHVLTTVLLQPGSGLAEADQWALNLARALEFMPVPKDAVGQTRWTQGTLVFHWQTVPLPTTNAPSALP